MEQPPDTLPLIADGWLIEGQQFLNQRFGDDLQFPIYVIRAPTTDDNVFMTIAGGADSLHYRDEITDWQTGDTRRNRMCSHETRPDLGRPRLHARRP